MNEEFFAKEEENGKIKENFSILINELNELLKSDKYTEIVGKYDELQKHFQNFEKLVQMDKDESKEKIKESA